MDSDTTPNFYYPGVEDAVWVDTPDDAPSTDTAYEWPTRRLCRCGPAVPRDELAGMLRPFVSSGSDEWEMADELLAYLDIRPKPEGETP